MTLTEIYAYCDERYKILPTHCRQEKLLLIHLRQKMVDKLKREHGFLKDEKEKVNS
jgi:hypothetical protein